MAWPNEVGPRYDAGITSPTYGNQGLYIKEGTYSKDLQVTVRDEVIASVAQTLVDRDISFWKRQTQVDWSQGQSQDVFTNPSRYRLSKYIDVRNPGTASLLPLPVANQIGVRAGHGGVVGRNSAGGVEVVFPGSTGGTYQHSANPLSNPPTWAFLGSPANPVNDLTTDAARAFFVFDAGGNGVYFTSFSPVAALAAWDTSALNLGRLAYDNLRKKLYATAIPNAANCAFYQINNGAAATTLYDFLTGFLGDIEMYQGSCILAWNSGFAGNPSPSAWTATLFRWDGANMQPFADLPDNTEVLAMKSYLGVLYILALTADPYTNVNQRVAVFYVVGSVGPQLLGFLDDTAGGVVRAASGISTGGPTVIFGVGQFVYFSIGDYFWKYDTVVGGLSKSFGGELGALNAVLGAVAVAGRIFVQVGNGGTGNEGVYIVASDQLARRDSASALLTSSRIDKGLPYVNAFWYCLEALFDPLVVGQQITMEYSLDDGTTFTACANSPLVAVGGETQLAFLVKKNNPHITYRVGLRPVAAQAGPFLHAIAARYTPVNANGSIYHLTAKCYDDIRGRNNMVEEAGYGKDTLAFLNNIARKGELVTFYEPNDKSRTAHSCWVVDAKQPVTNTSGVYKPELSEGDVVLTLWEAV